MDFTPVELEQYNRHLRLPGFGAEKQRHLKDARVLLVGAGGLGCPAGLYLAAAGVGNIGVVDFDCVERSNLQRQVAHTVSGIGQPKVESLVQAMRNINPLIQYHQYPFRLDAENIQAVMANYDLVLDGSDNFSTRFLVADACHLFKTPLLQGSVYEYQAQITLFLPEERPCYRCVFREPPSQNALAPCAEVGVLGVVPGAAGLMMATEAIKYLTGLPKVLHREMLVYSAIEQTVRRIRLARDEDCPLCGRSPSIVNVREIALDCAFNPADTDWEMTAKQAREWIAGATQVLDVREIDEFRSGCLPKALHLPLGQIDEASAAQALSKSRPILAYCQKGQRSLKAVQILRDLGYDQVYSLQGGIAAWNSPVELSSY